MTDESSLLNSDLPMPAKAQFREDPEGAELVLASQEIWAMATYALSGGQPLPDAGEKTPSGWAVLANLRFNGRGDLLAYGHLWALRDANGKIGFVVTTLRCHHEAKIVSSHTAKKIVASICDEAVAAAHFANSAYLAR